jgi:hypothetical protein
MFSHSEKSIYNIQTNQHQDTLFVNLFNNHHYQTTSEPPQALTVSMFYSSPPAPNLLTMEYGGRMDPQRRRHLFPKYRLPSTTTITATATATAVTMINLAAAIMSRFSFAATTTDHCCLESEVLHQLHYL